LLKGWCSNAHRVATHHLPQNNVLRVQLSRSQKDGSQKVLNQDCGEDEREQIQVTAHAFWNSEGILLMEFLKRGATI